MDFTKSEMDQIVLAAGKRTSRFTAKEISQLRAAVAAASTANEAIGALMSAVAAKIIQPFASELAKASAAKISGHRNSRTSRKSPKARGFLPKPKSGRR